MLRAALVAICLAVFPAAGVTDLTALIDQRDPTVRPLPAAVATRRNFEVAINRLIASASQGDLVIISFAGHGSQQPSTDLADGPPGSRRAGERDLVHQWMGDKVGPDVPAAGDHVDHRWREAAGLSG